MGDRRNFLKMFGAGAVVAPVVNGVVSSISAQARIITPAEVEIIPPPKVEACQSLPMGEPLQISVDIVGKNTGRYWHMEASVITEEQNFKPQITQEELRRWGLGRKIPMDYSVSLKLIGSAPSYLGMIKR